MARTYDPTSVSVEYEEPGFDLETEDDVRDIPLPTDWTLQSVEVFGSGVKAEWSRTDGGYIVITPYPYPKQYIHRVEFSGRTQDVEGWEEAVEKAVDFIRDHTADDPYEVQGPHTIQAQHSSDLQSDVPPMSIDAFEHDTIDLQCTNCGEEGLLISEQSMEMAVEKEIEIEYECICPSCGMDISVR